MVAEYDGERRRHAVGILAFRQFATDYQQLFAEKPSLTLHQRMRQWA